MGVAISFRAFKNVFVACTIMFIIAGTNVLGVYNVPIEESASDPDALDGVWTSSLAYANFACTIALMGCGVFLSQGSDKQHPASPWASKTSRIRITLLASAFSFSLLGLAGLGIVFESPLLIRFALLCMGFGYGACYLLGGEIATAWLPDNPGLAIGLCQTTYGLGSVVLSDVYSRFESNMNVVSAVYLTTALMAFSCLAGSVLVEWPEPPSSDESSESEDDPLLSGHFPDGIQLTWKTLLCLTVFWLYVITLSATQASYAFLPFFFDVGNSYGAPLHVQVRCFQVVSILSTIARPFFGGICERLKHSDPSSLGSKKVITAVLSAQLLLFLLMVPLSCFGSFVVIGGLIIVLYSGSTCLAIMLARELFGKNNSALVFGVGGSLALGVGGSFAVLMMEHLATEIEQFADDYSNYYWFCVAWTLVALLACQFLHRCTFAFQQPCPNDSKDTIVDTTQLGPENEKD